MAKRNSKQVIESRWEKKEQTGRVVRDDARSYVKAPITGKNLFQKEYLAAIQNKQVIVVDASAGVGKSFVAMSAASDALKKGDTDKIILTRPAVGMGNTLGLLKGDLRSKYEPYLLPLIDVMCNRYGKGFYEAGLSNGTIEFSPLEYVRGRNFEGIVIVDEGQNVKPHEMYTLLTRLSEGGKLIIIGDSTQTDIRGMTGLQWLKIFIEDHDLSDNVTMLKATSDDIVRGEFCKAVVKAMESDRKLGFTF